LRKESRKKGFTGFRNWINVKEELGNYGLQGHKAIIRGGVTGICVPRIVNFLLDEKIDEVTVDLPNCRYDKNDNDNTEKGLERRRIDVLLGIPSLKNMHDKRIKYIK
jgi:hypothetical protein